MQRILSARLPSILLARAPAPLLVPSCNVGLFTKFKFADNSYNSKRVTKLDRPYCIKTPRDNKNAGFGDIITIAHIGKVHKALVVSNRRPSKTLPRYDHGYIVLLDKNLDPVATRITIPIPSQLRTMKMKDKHSHSVSKIIALASRFI